MAVEIRELPRSQYAGYEFTVEYVADRFYDVELVDEGFRLRLKSCPPVKKGFSDKLFSAWLEAPVAFGAFVDGALMGFVEGSPESWHDMFRVSNIFVDPSARRKGLGRALLEHIVAYARARGDFRAVILETQSCNYPAISLYKKLGFRLCRIDICEYSNSDIENHEVRIDLALTL